MTDKSDLFVKFYRMVQTQFGNPIKRLLSDNGREYVNQNLSKFLKENEVVRELTSVNTPKKMELQKGKIVISLRLLELYSSKLLFIVLTGEAVLTVTYLINRLEGVSPDKLMTTLYPSIPIMISLQIHVSGCPVFVHVHSFYWGKLDPRAIKCVFIGYAFNKKGYKCYHSQSCKVYVSNDVTFHETKSFFPSSQLQRESIQEVKVLELSLFPLLQDFILMEDDKDTAPTSL